MLRLKENIDLNELEKYGFIEKYSFWVRMKTVYIPCYCISCENGSTGHSREIQAEGIIVFKSSNPKCRWVDRAQYGTTEGSNEGYYYNEFANEEYDALYDLINANLVEKVGSNENN